VIEWSNPTSTEEHSIKLEASAVATNERAITGELAIADHWQCQHLQFGK